MSRPDTDNFREIFLSDTPLLDTRAPVEFARGTLPGAVNLPLLSNAEREQIGIAYKQHGQQSAIELGLQLVSGEARDRRLASWIDFVQANPHGYLYCWRGGLRSQTVQQWLAENGHPYPLLIGGYKAARRYLLEQLQLCIPRADLALIAGATGCGKTRVVESLSSAIDLERLAVHRGSAFGHLLQPQPSQIDFENRLTVALMRLLEVKTAFIHLEDEGRLIGRLAVPEILRRQMEKAPLIVIEEPLASRVDVVVEDYIVDLGARFAEKFGEDGIVKHCERLLQDIDRISKRLGGQRTRDVKALLLEAFNVQENDGGLDSHRQWIELLLEKYYDPMYEYQMGRREGVVLFRGSRAEVLDFARAQGSSA